MRILSLLLLLTLVACSPYSKINFSRRDLESAPRFEKKIKEYRVYLHQKDTVTEFKNPRVEGNLIKGIEVAVPEDSLVEYPVTRTAKKQHRKDLHIYLDPNLPSVKKPAEESSTKKGNKAPTLSKINLDEVYDLSTMALLGYNPFDSIFWLVSLIVLGLIVGLIISIFVLLYVVVILLAIFG